MVLVGLKCVSQSVKYGLLPWPTAEKLPFLEGKVYPKINILSLTLLNLMSFQYFLRIWNTNEDFFFDEIWELSVPPLTATTTLLMLRKGK